MGVSTISAFTYDLTVTNYRGESGVWAFAQRPLEGQEFEEISKNTK